MKLPYLRRLLTLLAFFDHVLLFKPVGIPLESNTLDSDEEELPPTVPALKPVYCEELTECLDTDDKIYWRKLCFKETCPHDKVYHCGFAEDQQTIVEFYYPNYPCEKGYYGMPDVHGNNVKMACKMCPAGRFNPERRWSPGNMDQCSTHFHIPAEPHTVLFRPGNSTDPAIYFCDAKKGWASAHRSLFCKPSYQPCNCIYQGESCPGEDLLPDMRCVPHCEGKRLPEKNFACAQGTASVITHISVAVASSVPVRETSTVVETSTSLSTQATSPDAASTSPPRSGRDYDFKEYLIVGLPCGFVILLLIVAVMICCKNGNTCCKIIKNTWNIRGHNIDASHAENVEISKETEEESALFMSGNSTNETASCFGR